MLTRKPRIGERLDYDGRKRAEVLRFLDPPHENLMSMRYDDGTETLIIWRFHDGLNRLLSHIEESES